MSDSITESILLFERFRADDSLAADDSLYTTQLRPILCFVELSKALDGRDL